jgi:hypothetical protein
MLQATFTAAAIRPVLGQLDRTVRDFLDAWQDWSDRTFADIQPEILSAIESICYVVGYTAAMAWGFACWAVTTTVEAWETDLRQQVINAAALACDRSYAWGRTAIYTAYSAVVLSGIVAILAAIALIRYGSRAGVALVGWCLCATW